VAACPGMHGGETNRCSPLRSLTAVCFPVR